MATYLAAIPAEIIGHRGKIMDHPGERSSHSVAVPRTGGIAILLGMLAGIAIGGHFTGLLMMGLGSVAIIAAISLLDDVVTIPSGPRLLVHLGVTTGLVWLAGLELTEIGLPYLPLHLPRWAGLIVAVMFVAGFVNFFNFMDGINGISAAQGIVGGGALAVLLAVGGGHNSVVIALALAGACVGFAPHNFPTAKLFMGDSGSTILGYVLAMLTLAGAKWSPYPWPALIMPLGVFIYDAVFTLIKHILQGVKITKPHRDHHYQMLLRCGWSHTRVTLVQAGLMVLCSACGMVYAFGYNSGSDAVALASLAGLATIAGCYSVFVHRYFATHRQDAPGDATQEQDSP